MSAGHTVKSGVIKRKSSCLRGDCEAKINCMGYNFSFLILIPVQTVTQHRAHTGRA